MTSGPINTFVGLVGPPVCFPSNIFRERRRGFSLGPTSFACGWLRILLVASRVPLSEPRKWPECNNGSEWTVAWSETGALFARLDPNLIPGNETPKNGCQTELR